MPITVRGSLQVAARVENLGDLLNAQRGLCKPEFVRSLDIPDALIAPATSCFALPARLVAQLKLQRRATRKTRTADGFHFLGASGPFRLTVQERECAVDVLNVPDGCPVLIGQIPLRLLDLVFDPATNKLMGNPDHDGHPMADLS